MPICPKCRSEYENHVAICPDCKVNLVATEADIERWMPLVVTPVVLNEYVNLLFEAGITEYLYDYASDREGFVLQVKEGQYKAALEQLKQWQEKQLEEAEESEIVRIETEDVSADDEKAALKNAVSSYYSLAIVLAGLAVVDVAGILPVVIVTRYFLGVIAGIGAVICVFAAIKDKKKYTLAIEHAQKKEDVFKANLTQVREALNKTAIKADIAKATEGLDEGAKYYVVHDILVAKIESLNADYEASYVNTLADHLIDEFLAH